MSELRADTITASDGTSPVTLTGQTAAKAWGNTSGDGTPVIDGSFNTSSLTDNGVGQQTYYFVNSMDSSAYSAKGTPIETGYAAMIQILGQVSSNFNLKSHNGNASGNSADSDGKNYTVNGDLA